MILRFAQDDGMDAESEMLRRERAEELFAEGYRQQMAGALTEAKRLYRESIALWPTAEGYTFLGWTYSFEGRWEDAIEECLRAIEVDPTFGNPYNDIGAYLIELDREDEAIQWFEKALKAPRYESYCFPHFNMGRVYEKKGQYEKALSEFRAAQKENPQHRGALAAVRRLQAMKN